MEGYFNLRDEPVVRLAIGCLSVEVLVETGFDGSLIFPAEVADNMGLKFDAHQDFSSVTGATLFASACSTDIDWLGRRFRVAVARCGEVSEALLGSHMLKDCRLTIDYRRRTVTIMGS